MKSARSIGKATVPLAKQGKALPEAESRRKSIAATMLPTAEAVGGAHEQLRVLDNARVERDFLDTDAENLRDLLDGGDAAAVKKRHETLGCRSLINSMSGPRLARSGEMSSTATSSTPLSLKIRSALIGSPTRSSDSEADRLDELAILDEKHWDDAVSKHTYETFAN